MKTIEVTISTSGETTIVTKGFEGSACRAASQFLEAALGSRLSEQLTAEFHAATQSTETHHRQGT